MKEHRAEAVYVGFVASSRGVTAYERDECSVNNTATSLALL